MWYGFVGAQSLPTIGSTMSTATISQPYTQNQCKEPDGTIVYETRHFYLGDTYTTKDVVPKWGWWYDTLLLQASKVLIYNPSLFNFTTPITYMSNGIPNNAAVSSMIAAKGTFIVNSTTPGQLVYNIYRTALENAGNTSYTISYLGYSNNVQYTTTLSHKTFHNQAWWVRNGYECVNYTVHYCGDGVKDTQQSIASLAGGIATSLANEQCDGTDGVSAGQACNSSCQLVTPPSCTLTPATQTLALGMNGVVSWNITWVIFSSQNTWFMLSYSPTTYSLTWLPYLVTSNQWSRTFTPTHVGTYVLSMTVYNSTFSGVCTGKVTVITPPQLSLSKHVINDIIYYSGDHVAFRIDFANVGDTTVHNAILTDYLPAGLVYESSQIYGIIPPYGFGTHAQWTTTVIEYSGFTLTPWQQGYMIVTGVYKGNDWSNYRLNTVTLDSDETDMLNAADDFSIYIPTANATITKSVERPSYYLGEDARFTIAVINNWPDIVENVQITDQWPNTSCLTIDPTWTANTPMNMTNTTNPYTWTLINPLPVGQPVYIYLTWHIGTSPSCVGNYINVVNLRYMVNGQIKTGTANATITVLDIPTSVMGIEKKLLQYGNRPWDAVTFEIIYTNRGNATINTYTVTDYWPGTLQYVSATPSPNSQTSHTSWLTLQWIYSTPLAPYASGHILVQWTIR